MFMDSKPFAAFRSLVDAALCMLQLGISASIVSVRYWVKLSVPAFKQLSRKELLALVVFCFARSRWMCCLINCMRFVHALELIHFTPRPALCFPSDSSLRYNRCSRELCV